MTIEERRARDRAARRRLIVKTARRLAEAEGWDAVTTRRLAMEIEYSQPVLYKHFPGMDAIAEAVAVDGFAELADTLARARVGSREQALRRIAHAYIDFARDNPALYDAMFIRASTLRFAVTDTPPELVAAFGELRAAVAAIHGHIDLDTDVDTLTEIVWAALHGLAMLSRSGRLRPNHESERIQLLTSQFSRAAAS